MECPEFDSLPPDFLADPYRYYSSLRAQDPAYLSSRGVWILSRYEDVAFVLRDQRFGREGFRDLLGEHRPEPPAEQPTSMLFQDSRGHMRLRTLISKALTPSLIQSLRPRIQQIVNDLLDCVQTARAIDLIAELALPLPVHVISELLGVPPAHRDLFHDWSLSIARGVAERSVGPDGERTWVIHEAIADYFHVALAERRQHPRDDLLTRLIASERDGDKLTEFEILDICGLLFIAGHETTVDLIGNGILALLLHPGELRLLRENLDLLPAAIEEVLRYDSPVQRASRMTRMDVPVAGKTIPKGAVVSAVLGAANRDPAHFHEPDRLNIARRDNSHLAFGAGDRFCLGALLARLEAQIAIGALVRRFPSLELAAQAPAWRHTTETRGLRELRAIL